MTQTAAVAAAQGLLDAATEAAPGLIAAAEETLVHAQEHALAAGDDGGAAAAGRHFDEQLPFKPAMQYLIDREYFLSAGLLWLHGLKAGQQVGGKT